MAAGEPMAEDEKRARATFRKAFTVARENYLMAAGWIQVGVDLPREHTESGGGGVVRVWMWAKQHEVKNKKIHQLYSTKLAMESQEEFDGYFD
jgi:hypothetical protein